MVEGNQQPPLRPTLHLLMKPIPDPIEGRGKGEHTVKRDRFEEQRKHLVLRLKELSRQRDELTMHASKLLLNVRMFDDSLAQSHTPHDIFNRIVGCRFVAPQGNGYLVEFDFGQLKEVASRIVRADTWGVRSDISRVQDIEPFNKADLLRGRTIDQIWDRAVEEASARFFLAWLRPYHDDNARETVLQQFQRLGQERILLSASRVPSSTTVRDGRGAGDELVRALNTSIARAMQDYRRTRGVGRALVKVTSQSNLQKLIASGTVMRIDPARPFRLASGVPLPTVASVPSLSQAPVIACIDGGLHSKAYKAAEAWSAPPLVPDHEADKAHGDAISSLLVHASQLNPHLELPSLGARVGTLQAVPHKKSNSYIKPDDLMDSLQAMASRHREAKVWNLSMNLDELDDEPEVMSDFGHQLALVARAAKVLPVVSIGNVAGDNTCLLPPADCEAALTVGGRVATKKGKPGGHCEVCCEGPGPAGMLKPEVSWISPLQVAGSKKMIGSSFATAITSVLAAHTYDRLKQPTPDLVRALLIDRTELDVHSPKLGWGTPYDGAPPWECAQGCVTMTWQAELLPGFEYHWNNIPIPAEMRQVVGRLNGGASLTAILEPLVSPFAAANYFASRVEVALQFRGAQGKWQNLLGTMRESTISESEARSDLKKWHPIRHHKKSKFSRELTGNHLRLRARLFTRDLFQPGMPAKANLPPQTVAFVLTLKSTEGNSQIYDSVVRGLGNFVESAVFEQNIIVEDDE